MLTRIRNGLLARKKVINVPYSKFKEEIAKILSKLGFVGTYSVLETEDGPHKEIVIKLKYVNREPAILGIKRQSRPGCRFYSSSNVRVSGCPQHSISILSTSRGVLSNKEAAEQGIGGEVVCTVW